MLENVQGTIGLDYVEDFEKIVSLLEDETRKHLNNLAHKVSYHSIQLEDLQTNIKLSRNNRKEIFLFLAIYGTPLGAALTHLFVGVGGMPVPTTLFALLMCMAGSEDVPTGYVVQATATIRSLVHDIKYNSSEISELKALLSSAFLNKIYAS